MTAFLPILAATMTQPLVKSILNTVPLCCGIAAGLLAGFLLTRFLDRKSGKHKTKQGLRR